MKKFGHRPADASALTIPAAASVTHPMITQHPDASQGRVEHDFADRSMRESAGAQKVESSGNTVGAGGVPDAASGLVVDVPA